MSKNKEKNNEVKIELTFDLCRIQPRRGGIYQQKGYFILFTFLFFFTRGFYMEIIPKFHHPTQIYRSTLRIVEITL